MGTEAADQVSAIGDLVRAWAATHASGLSAGDAVAIETAGTPTVRQLPAIVAPGVMEHTLARRGIWSIEPDRTQQELRFTSEDVQGTLLIEYGLGQLSVADLRLVAWLLGRWREDEPTIAFSLRRCTEEMGLEWKGQRVKTIRQQLERIYATRFKGRIYNASKRVHEEVWFGILDVVSFRDWRDSFDAEGEGTTVRISLSTFIADNLRASHFARIDLGRLAQLSTDVAQRVYVFLESQRGFPRAGANLYEIAIDTALQASLGSSDRIWRFRTKLAQAGEQICAIDERYRNIEVRPGKERRSWVLSVRRRQR